MVNCFGRDGSDLTNGNLKWGGAIAQWWSTCFALEGARLNPCHLWLKVFKWKDHIPIHPGELYCLLEQMLMTYCM